MNITITKRLTRDEDTYIGEFPYGDETSEYFDAVRTAAWYREAWHYIGVVAEATLEFPYGEDAIKKKIRSPGLWGIESDSEESYLQEVFEEEKKILIEMIEAFKREPLEITEA